MLFCYFIATFCINHVPIHVFLKLCRNLFENSGVLNTTTMTTLPKTPRDIH